MHHLIALVNHPENVAVLRAELWSTDGQYGRGDEDPNGIPGPYAAFLGLSVDYGSRGGSRDLRFLMGIETRCFICFDELLGRRRVVPVI